MAMTLMSSLSVLAGSVPAETPQPQPTQPTRYVDPAVVGPGLIGFILFVVLLAAVFLLWRSMNKQLSRIDFDEDGTAPRPVNAPFSRADVREDPSEGTADPAAAGVAAPRAAGDPKAADPAP